MQNYVHIKPNYNLLLKTKDLEVELKKSKIYTFLVEDTSAVFSFFSLENENFSLPFSYKFDKNDFSSTKNVKATLFPENNYLLEISPFFIQNQNEGATKSKILNFGGKSHTLFWFKNSKCRLKLENDDSKIYLENDVEITDLKTKQSGDAVVVFCKTKDERYVIFEVFFKNQNYILNKTEIVDLLEEEKDKLLTYKNCLDFSGHGITTEYDFSSTYQKTSSTVYNDELPSIANKKEIIPFAFFEAVKTKNFDLAKRYLSKNLASKLDENHLSLFFGEFETAHQPLTQTYDGSQIALIYNDNKSSIAKLFNFQFDEQNKISNIEEI